MPEREAKKLLESAIAAGAKRDYRGAIEYLRMLLSQTDDCPEAFLYLGRSHYALGQHGPAIEAFRRYLEAGGDQAAGLFFLGRAYFSAGHPQEASRCLKKSAELDPERAPTWAFLGAALLKRKRSRLAVECLERAVSLAPDDKHIYRGYLNALYGRGVRLLMKGEADMARQVLGFALSNGLDGAAIRLWHSKALRENGQFQEALAECDEALRLQPSDPSIAWLRAGILLAAGRQKEALAQFDALRADNPELPDLPPDALSLRRLRASIAFHEGNYKEAISSSLVLLRANPKDAALRALVAESLRSTGELEKSREHWLRAVEAAPNEASFRLGLALTLYDSGEYEEALRVTERARKLGASSEDVDYYAALCKARLGQNPQTLLPVLQKLLSSPAHAGDPRLMFALGEALYRMGRADLAGGWFDKVLMLAPDHELSLLYRISVAESLQSGEDRNQAYQDYLEVYPDNQKLRREYIAILAAEASWSEAASVIEGGLTYGSPDLKTRRLLATSYRKAGRYREASIAYRDMLREEPTSGEYLMGLAVCLEKDGKGSFALALLEAAPAQAKAQADPWLVQAALYSKSGNFEKAVAALRMALEKERGNQRAWANLAAIYRRQGLTSMAANVEEEGRAVLAELARKRSQAASRAASQTDQPTAAGKKAAGKTSKAGKGLLFDEDGLPRRQDDDLDIRSRRKP